MAMAAPLQLPDDVAVYQLAFPGRDLPRAAFKTLRAKGATVRKVPGAAKGAGPA